MNTIRSVARWLGHRHSLRHAIKHRLLIGFHNPDKVKTEPFTTRFFGLTYEGNFNSYIDWNIYYFGAYARHELLFLQVLARQFLTKSVFIDVGANVGNHSLFASTVFGMVYAFEPVPHLLRKLNEQCQRNNIGNLQTFPYALGERDARQEFYSSAVANEGMGTLLKDREVQNTNVFFVEVRRGDSLLKARQIDRVDIIKIDVEGFERQVLNGLSDTIQTYRPVIFFEWSEATDEPTAPLPAQPYFADYVFFRFNYGKTINLFFEQDCFSLTEVAALTRNHNYVAVPKEKYPLLARYYTKS